MRSLFITLSILLFATHSFGYTCHAKRLTCPIDGDTFTVYITGSYTIMDSKKDFESIDWQSFGRIYSYTFHSCPICRYSGYYDDFDTVFSKEATAGILSILAPFKTSKMDDALRCEIAAKIIEYRGGKNDEVAYAYRVESYIIRDDTAMQPQRKWAQLQCIDYLKRAVAAKEYASSEKYAEINYLIGELYRRNADFDHAMQYYDKVLSEPDKEKWLNDMAREQRAVAVNKDADNYF
jgi:uncharacterized protein (DUF2225 family)